MILRQSERLARHQPDRRLRHLGDVRDRQRLGRAPNARTRPGAVAANRLLLNGSSARGSPLGLRRRLDMRIHRPTHQPYAIEIAAPDVPQGRWRIRPATSKEPTTPLGDDDELNGQGWIQKKWPPAGHRPRRSSASQPTSSSSSKWSRSSVSGVGNRAARWSAEEIASSPRSAMRAWRLAASISDARCG